MSRHTRGSWTVDDYQAVGGKRVLIDVDGQHLATLFPIGDEEETKANATLIAAAPDLLSALQRVRMLFDTVPASPYWDHDTWTSMTPAVNGVYAALRKVYGDDLTKPEKRGLQKS